MNLRLKSRCFRAARIHSGLHSRTTRQVQMSQSEKMPGPLFIRRMLHRDVLIAANDPQAVLQGFAIWKILNRPVRISAVGDHRPQLVWHSDFGLDRGLNPTLLGKTKQQTGLIVLMRGMRKKRSRRCEIASRFAKKKM